jgi:GNAT superfamily N-acetyltransferase
MIHSDLALAIRLEQAAAAFGYDAVQTHRGLFPQSSAEAVAFGSGVSLFLNEESPLTQVRGAGMSGVMAASDVDEMEAFFNERMAPVTITVTPFADSALLTHLSRRGYEFGCFLNTLVRDVSPADVSIDSDVVLAGDEREWSLTMAEAFFDVVTPMGIELGRTLFRVPTCRNLIIRAGAEPAAGAQLEIRNGLGVLQCDGTLARFRGEGLQSKLIRARLSLAAEAGCDLVTADTAPGSQSQRNYERLGFRVVYTKITLIKPCF